MNGLVERKTGAAAILEGLSSKLAPAEPSQVKEAVARLLAAYPSANAGDPRHGEMLIRTYAAALSGLPLWAITGAAQAFIRGTADGYNPAFRPTPPQWAKEARKQTDGIYQQMAWQRACVASSSEPRESDEVREQVKRQFNALIEKLSQNGGDQPIKRSEDWRDVERALIVGKSEPWPTLSPEAMRLIGAKAPMPSGGQEGPYGRHSSQSSGMDDKIPI